ncbi:hypothetical protein GWI33_004556 [Rhynchophorus ferrugineus]|uniref:DNA-directed RNA polymerase I subunit RPA49 n=1 Tax=Rhynchophorus ferrugineus TaxID=354439 RepID=A0A834MIL7_RHYFE|nr:hypothetical protein GWI33_004556 [Rhynchophorus ferrugineus]
MPKIKTITRNKNKPVLFEFQNGKIKQDNDCLLEVALFRDKVKNKKILGVSNGDMIYSGEVNNDDLFNNFLAISKKGGKEIELVEIETTSLTPFLKQTIAVASPVKQHAVSELQKKFGSKKAKRYTEQHERLAMNLEHVTGRLEKIVEGMDVDVETNIIPETPSDSGYRPKINRDASTKEGVYILSDLVTDDILNSLEEKLDSVLDAADIKKCGLTSVIENQIQSLQEQSLPEQIFKDKCKILLCVNNLIEFMKTPTKSMTKKYMACNYSILMDKYIKKNFMVNSTRSLNMRDKCVCYIIVLIMIAVNYEMDLDILAKDLKIGLNKAKELARHLGFSQSTKSKTGIVLKIPVPPPPTLFMKKKKN